LQIFTPESVLVLKVFVLDAELNFASNGDIFKRGHRAKGWGFRPKYMSMKLSADSTIFKKYSNFELS
jgi:hypothetical protein